MVCGHCCQQTVPFSTFPFFFFVCVIFGRAYLAVHVCGAGFRCHTCNPIYLGYGGGPIWLYAFVVPDFGANHVAPSIVGCRGGLFGHVCLWCQILVPCVQLSQTMTLELRRHVTMGRSHDQTGSDPSRDLTCDKSCDQAPKPASNQSCDKEREHDLMHAYFCRYNLCYIHDRY